MSAASILVVAVGLRLVYTGSRAADFRVPQHAELPTLSFPILESLRADLRNLSLGDYIPKSENVQRNKRRAGVVELVWPSISINHSHVTGLRARLKDISVDQLALTSVSCIAMYLLPSIGSLTRLHTSLRAALDAHPHAIICNPSTVDPFFYRIYLAAVSAPPASPTDIAHSARSSALDLDTVDTPAPFSPISPDAPPKNSTFTEHTNAAVLPHNHDIASLPVSADHSAPRPSLLAQSELSRRISSPIVASSMPSKNATAIKTAPSSPSMSGDYPTLQRAAIIVYPSPQVTKAEAPVSPPTVPSKRSLSTYDELHVAQVRKLEREVASSRERADELAKELAESRAREQQLSSDIDTLRARERALATEAEARKGKAERATDRDAELVARLRTLLGKEASPSNLEDAVTELEERFDHFRKQSVNAIEAERSAREAYEYYEREAAKFKNANNYPDGAVPHLLNAMLQLSEMSRMVGL